MGAFRADRTVKVVPLELIELVVPKELIELGKWVHSEKVGADLSVLSELKKSIRAAPYQYCFNM